MAMHKIRIIQVFKATRTIEMGVEAEHQDEAVEAVSSGAIDTPDFDNTHRKTGWDLQNEEVEPA